MTVTSPSGFSWSWCCWFTFVDGGVSSFLACFTYRLVLAWIVSIAVFIVIVFSCSCLRAFSWVFGSCIVSLPSMDFLLMFLCWFGLSPRQLSRHYPLPFAGFLGYSAWLFLGRRSNACYIGALRVFTPRFIRLGCVLGAIHIFALWSGASKQIGCCKLGCALLSFPEPAIIGWCSSNMHAPAPPRARVVFSGSEQKQIAKTKFGVGFSSPYSFWLTFAWSLLHGTFCLWMGIGLMTIDPPMSFHLVSPCFTLNHSCNCPDNSCLVCVLFSVTVAGFMWEDAGCTYGLSLVACLSVHGRLLRFTCCAWGPLPFSSSFCFCAGRLHGPCGCLPFSWWSYMWCLAWAPWVSCMSYTVCLASFFIHAHCGFIKLVLRRHVCLGLGVCEFRSYCLPLSALVLLVQVASWSGYYLGLVLSCLFVLPCLVCCGSLGLSIVSALLSSDSFGLVWIVSSWVLSFVAHFFHVHIAAHACFCGCFACFLFSLCEHLSVIRGAWRFRALLSKCRLHIDRCGPL